jgi:uncharacterized protein YndB with AHSA1/START domain
MVDAPLDALPPVRVGVDVPCPPDEAFRKFTSGISEWWPLEEHSVGGAETERCTLEAKVGGRLYERTRDGREHLWGTVLTWDPPRRFVVTWHPGREPETAQELEVIVGSAPGGARVGIDHRNWDVLGADEGPKKREEYEQGWKRLLEERFAPACGR